MPTVVYCPKYYYGNFSGVHYYYCQHREGGSCVNKFSLVGDVTTHTTGACSASCDHLEGSYEHVKPKPGKKSARFPNNHLPVTHPAHLQHNGLPAHAEFKSPFCISSALPNTATLDVTTAGLVRYTSGGQSFKVWLLKLNFVDTAANIVAESFIGHELVPNTTGSFQNADRIGGPERNRLVRFTIAGQTTNYDVLVKT